MSKAAQEHFNRMYRAHAIATEDEVEYRKMLKEMLDSDDKGFSESAINLMESFNKQTGYLSKRQKEVIRSMYIYRM